MNNKTLTGEEALLEAQKIAFGPVIFQAARLLRDFGVFQFLQDNKKTGLSVSQLAEKTGKSIYAIEILCESGLSMNALSMRDEVYHITSVGYFLLVDEMTNVNMDFNHDVNYLGLYNLEESLNEAKPVGLQKAFDSSWETIYPHLSKLPGKAKESWFGFDHFYSDAAFVSLVKVMSKKAPKKLMDIGGNTGKWALALTQASQETEVTILDHQGQIDVALENAKKAGVQDRVSGVAMDLLDHSKPFPKGHDAIWMSQFLDCFSKEDVVALLKRANEALDADGRIYINEPFWDRQSHDIGAYVLINTSPYFTALANGQSKMYRAKEMSELAEKAGLKVVEEINGLGFGHTLMVCAKA
jgi:ubiquinone/menaquinone biosynthesis C-methylase UbiE